MKKLHTIISERDNGELTIRKIPIDTKLEGQDNTKFVKFELS
jgi:hypothetical protein